MKIDVKRKQRLLLMVSLTILGFLVLISLLALTLKGQFDNKKKVEIEKQQSVDTSVDSDAITEELGLVDEMNTNTDTYIFNRMDANHQAHGVRYVEFNHLLYVAQVYEKKGTTVYDLGTSKAIRYIEKNQALFATAEFIYFIVEDMDKRKMVKEDKQGNISVVIEDLKGEIFQGNDKLVEFTYESYQGEVVLITEKEIFTLDQRGLNRYNIETQELIQSYIEIEKSHFLDIQMDAQRVYILTDKDLFFIEEGQMQQLLSNAFYENQNQITRLYEKSGALYAWVVDGNDPKNIYIAYVDRENRQFYEVAQLRLSSNELEVGAIIKEAWVSFDAQQGLHIYPLASLSQGELKPYLQLLSEMIEEETLDEQGITTYIDVSTGLQIDLLEGYTKEKLASGVTRLKINPFIELSYIAYNGANFIEKDYDNAVLLVDPLATTNSVSVSGSSEAFESYLIKNGDYEHQIIFKAGDLTYYVTARLLKEAPEASADLLMMILDSVAVNLAAVVDSRENDGTILNFLDLQSVHLAFIDSDISGEIKAQIQVKEMAQTLNESDGAFSWQIEVITDKGNYTVIIDEIIMHTDQTSLKNIESYRTRLMKEIEGVKATSEIQGKVSVSENSLLISGVYLPNITLFDVSSITFTTELNDTELDRLIFYQRLVE